MTPEQLLVQPEPRCDAARVPAEPVRSAADFGQPATCKGPAFYNNFYGAGEVDALATIR